LLSDIGADVGGGCRHTGAWTLILRVTGKYIMLVMRADNRGEGSVLALMAPVQWFCA
jgi:K+ transporter